MDILVAWDLFILLQLQDSEQTVDDRNVPLKHTVIVVVTQVLHFITLALFSQLSH